MNLGMRLVASSIWCLATVTTLRDTAKEDFDVAEYETLSDTAEVSAKDSTCEDRAKKFATCVVFGKPSKVGRLEAWGLQQSAEQYYKDQPHVILDRDGGECDGQEDGFMESKGVLFVESFPRNDQIDYEVVGGPSNLSSTDRELSANDGVISRGSAKWNTPVRNNIVSSGPFFPRANKYLAKFLLRDRQYHSFNICCQLYPKFDYQKSRDCWECYWSCTPECPVSKAESKELGCNHTNSEEKKDVVGRIERKARIAAKVRRKLRLRRRPGF